MLTFYGFDIKGPVSFNDPKGDIPAGANWIDAFQPTDDERAFLQRVLGAEIPAQADLEEIESSSRLATDGPLIVMSLAATARDETGFPKMTPIGFMMSRDRLLTVRFDRLPSFESLAKRLTEKGDLAEGGIGAIVTILEIIIDQIADGLERIAGELDHISREAFGPGMMSSTARPPRKSGDAMRVMMGTVGRSGDLASRFSQSLLGISRMVPYIAGHAVSYLTPDCQKRLEIVGQDAKSLYDYEEHLSNKTQFLLDTLLGFANIDQNNVFRVLTVVSVVGIPPTFFASMWGMNFKSMPELDLPHGYAMALSVIAISAIAPAVWFKIKGWW